MTHALPNAQNYHEHHFRPPSTSKRTSLPASIPAPPTSAPFALYIPPLFTCSSKDFVPSSCIIKPPSFLAHSPHQTCCSISNLKSTQPSLPQILSDHHRSITLLTVIVKHRHRAALPPCLLRFSQDLPQPGFPPHPNSTCECR